MSRQNRRASTSIPMLQQEQAGKSSGPAPGPIRWPVLFLTQALASTSLYGRQRSLAIAVVGGAAAVQGRLAGTPAEAGKQRSTKHRPRLSS